MQKQRTYFTGLVTIGKEFKQPKPPFHGAGWTAREIRPRAERHCVDKQREIVLQARSWSAAQRGLDLILGCHQLLTGEPSDLQPHQLAHNDKEPEWMRPQQRRNVEGTFYSTGDFPLACRVAAKASKRRRWTYAIAKYSFSKFLFSVYSIDLEPGLRHFPVSRFPEDQVKLSHAIISGYAAIEDLGLELRASASRPSRIDGQWNPIVKEELESRLRLAGIDLSETILWTARGSKRKTELKRPMSIVQYEPWVWGPIRDAEVHVIDAIAYSDWLRDCVAAHGFKTLTASLSPYDVVNVQHISRRLILESLGFWRYK